MGKNLGGIMKNAAVGAGLLLAVGCDSVEEHELGVVKTYGGKIVYHEGPRWDYLGQGTSSIEWDGRRIIDLPLTKGSEELKQYATANDGYLVMDLTVYYGIGKTDTERNKWFKDVTDPESQFPKAVDGVVRSTVKGYTNNEILNEELAKKNGKKP